MTIAKPLILQLNAVCFDRPKMMHSLSIVLEHYDTIDNAIIDYCLHQNVKDSAKDTLLTRSKKFNLNRLEDQLKKYKITPIYFKDDTYPNTLKEISFPPLVLFVKGDPKLLKSDCFAVVGPRSASPYGQQVCKFFSKSLCEQFTIVSGLARGIDTIAHEITLQKNKHTIAVLGHGLDICFPTENLHLFCKIEEHGLLVSEFPPGVPSLAHHFPQRNRLVSGLSRGVLVIEGSTKSGALVTAKYACEANRDVFAVPGDIFSPLAAGPHRLIQDGAKLVNSPQDIFREYEQLFPNITTNVVTTAPPELSTEEELSIWNALKQTPQHIDTIANTTKLTIPLIFATLSKLELSNAIETLPGNCYALKS